MIARIIKNVQTDNEGKLVQISAQEFSGVLYYEDFNPYAVFSVVQADSSYCATLVKYPIGGDPSKRIAYTDNHACVDDALLELEYAINRYNKTIDGPGITWYAPQTLCL